jgi:hypothetical protein
LRRFAWRALCWLGARLTQRWRSALTGRLGGASLSDGALGVLRCVPIHAASIPFVCLPFTRTILGSRAFDARWLSTRTFSLLSLFLSSHILLLLSARVSLLTRELR